jgi:hypothetical protein
MPRIVLITGLPAESQMNRISRAWFCSMNRSYAFSWTSSDAKYTRGDR